MDALENLAKNNSSGAYAALHVILSGLMGKHREPDHGVGQQRIDMSDFSRFAHRKADCLDFRNSEQGGLKVGLCTFCKLPFTGFYFDARFFLYCPAEKILPCAWNVYKVFTLGEWERGWGNVGGGSYASGLTALTPVYPSCGTVPPLRYVA